MRSIFRRGISPCWREACLHRRRDGARDGGPGGSGTCRGQRCSPSRLLLDHPGSRMRPGPARYRNADEQLRGHQPESRRQRGHCPGPSQGRAAEHDLYRRHLGERLLRGRFLPGADEQPGQRNQAPHREYQPRDDDQRCGPDRTRVGRSRFQAHPESDLRALRVTGSSVQRVVTPRLPRLPPPPRVHAAHAAIRVRS